MPVIKHTDGNIMPLMDMILDAGFECLDPIDPLGGMDMAFMKRTYGRPARAEGQRELRHDARERNGRGGCAGDAGRDPGRRPKAAG